MLYKFNNWVLYSEETDDELVNGLWKINTNNFKENIERLVQIPKRTFFYIVQSLLNNDIFLIYHPSYSNSL